MRDERLPGPGYLPASITPNPEDPDRVIVDWADFGGVALDEAFFGWSIRRMIAGGASMLQTDLAELLRFHRRLGARPPAGFVSHMTRCGSTLLARALHRLPRAVCFPNRRLSTPHSFRACGRRRRRPRFFAARCLRPSSLPSPTIARMDRRVSSSRPVSGRGAWPLP